MPAVGDLLADRYRIDGVLGAGGMASVYLATDLRLERAVAVKVLLPNLARDPALAERFDREARILASISHPNVAEVFDVERGDPAVGREPFYVMELCEGGSLAGRIEAGGPLEPGALVPIVISIAAALGELHRRGLIHRDVKPANILFAGGRPKLADFGLTKSGESLGLDTLTAPGTAIGTPAYMAPELVLGGPATPASDVYALAATTFHGLTGRAPRQTDSLTTLAAGDPTPLPRVSEVSPRLSSSFDAVVAAGLADDPAGRPSLNAFTAALVSALDRSPAGEPPLAAAPAEAVAAPVAAAAAPVAPVDTNADTTTIVVPPLPTRIPPAPPARPAAPARGRRPERSSLPLTSAFLAVAFFALGLLALSGLSSLLQGLGQAGTAPPSLRATSKPSSAPTQPSPTPAATPVPTPTKDPLAPALQALDRLIVAIDQARGGRDGLKGGAANELNDMALDIGRRLRAGDVGGARRTATALQERIRKLKLGKQQEQAIGSAIDDLIAVLPS